MGRWTDMDGDSHRLPEGFERTGYDADTQIYTFRDAEGNTYESEHGNRYGKLRPVGLHLQRDSLSSSSSTSAEDNNREPSRSFAEMLGSQDAEIKNENRNAVRMMLPFALLVLVFLILLFKFVDRRDADDAFDGQIVDCGQGSHQVQIKAGDTCWAIAQGCGLGVEELLGLGGNEGVDCGELRVGMGICVPV
ncbi:hypothetical protein EJ02DRAFT_505768 [Clathrospora elynae]|uniref:LysM domain-containing protein n=1 Tax=Clathrospora elynae TaxID=706981 RepID=A0A6A5SDK6_9PLEO|nr:hypothetical protein EJ02DRAFT_505768 [Clathrospora elynae]